jgi:hypothetical protein
LAQLGSTNGSTDLDETQIKSKDTTISLLIGSCQNPDIKLRLADVNYIIESFKQPVHKMPRLPPISDILKFIEAKKENDKFERNLIRYFRDENARLQKQLDDARYNAEQYYFAMRAIMREYTTFTANHVTLFRDTADNRRVTVATFRKVDYESANGEKPIFVKWLKMTPKEGFVFPDLKHVKVGERTPVPLVATSGMKRIKVKGNLKNGFDLTVTEK